MSRGIDLIFEIWGNRVGYVFAPYKDKSGNWTEQSFQWPRERTKVRDWIINAEQKKRSIYWCPTVFREPIRKKEYVKGVPVLWADLDEVNPKKLPKFLRPHLAYETSPKRFQCLWYLDKDYDPEEAEEVNRNITYFVDADKGGWDLTQVLRVPGFRNFKYPNGPQGNILWEEITQKTLSFYKKKVPEYEDTDVDIEDYDIEWLDDGDLLKILSKHKKKLKGKLFDLLLADEDEVAQHDRSAKLWEIECRLCEAGVEVEDIVNIIRLSNWNKYDGRHDEKKRIISEVLKAKAETEQATYSSKKSIRSWDSYEDLMGLSTANPGWLVEGWWQKGSHGIVAGEPKTYKSTFVADFAISVASGQPLYGIFPVHTQGPVIMVQEENSPFLMKDRFTKITNHKGLLEGKVRVRSQTTLDVTFPPSLPIHLLNNKGFDFTEEDSRDELERKIKKVRPVLLVLDPLYLMLGGKDENSAKDVRPILNWLLSLRYTYGCAVVLVHHWNKGGQSPRGGQRMLGSVLFHGWVESAVYNLVKNEEEHEVTIQREFRSFPRPKDIDIKYTMGNPGQLEYNPEFVESMTEDELLNYISSHNGVTEKELTAAMGLGRTALNARLKKLEQQNRIFKDNSVRPAVWRIVKVEVEEE